MCICAHTHTDRQTDRPTYLPTFPTYLPTYLPTCAYIYIYIYMYIHTWLLCNYNVCIYIYILVRFGDMTQLANEFGCYQVFLARLQLDYAWLLLWVCGPGETPGVYQLRHAFLIRGILGEFCVDGQHAFQLRASRKSGAGPASLEGRDETWYTGWWFGCHFLFSHMLGC